jgi:segregation and condensation protein B
MAKKAVKKKEASEKKKVHKNSEEEKEPESLKLETYSPEGPEIITEPKFYSEEENETQEYNSGESEPSEISATIIEVEESEEQEMALPSKTTSEIDDSIEKSYVKRIEAILFISARYLTMQELISLSDLNPIIIRECLDALKEKYDQEDMAMEIVSRGEGGSNVWKMDIRKEFTNITSKLATGSSEFSKAEMETLGIIAYKQPIKQSVVIKIRSNKAYDHIKKFSDLGLIKKKKVGHTNELSLSDEFYDYFNLSEAGGKDFLKKHSEEEHKDG